MELGKEEYAENLRGWNEDVIKTGCIALGKIRATPATPTVPADGSSHSDVDGR